MKSRKAILLLSFILFSLVLNLLRWTPVLAATNEELMVTSLETDDTVTVDQKVTYQVHVVSMDPANPKATMKNEDEANVTVYFKNTDNKLIKTQPSFEKNGIYKGTVTLTTPGQWDVLVTALRKGEKEAADSSNVYTLTTQVAVHPAHQKEYIWLYVLISLVCVTLIFLFIRWTRRRHRTTKI